MTENNASDKTVVIRTKVADEGYATIYVCVDGEQIASGYIGGEPEDNTYHRDYDWIDSALRVLAEKLGANVFVEIVKWDD